MLEKIENRESTFVPDEETYELYRDGFLPVALVEDYAKGGIHANTIIKNLKKRKKIEHKLIRKTKNSKKKLLESNVAVLKDLDIYNSNPEKDKNKR